METEATKTLTVATTSMRKHQSTINWIAQNDVAHVVLIQESRDRYLLTALPDGKPMNSTRPDAANKLRLDLVSELERQNADEPQTPWTSVG